MEMIAFFLLWFDRLAYIYAGVPGQTAFYLVRISNFAVFFFTSGIVFGFNLYLSDWMTHEGKLNSLPFRLKLVQALALIGMLTSVISAFTDLYYYFDETNRYHRGNGFLIAYVFPVIGPILQYTVIRQYRRIFSKLIYSSLAMYIFVPIACGILQIFIYGISIVNISMVFVSIFLYVFTYLDVNNTVEHAYKIEMQNMQDTKERALKLFDRTVMAVVSEIEKKDGLDHGGAALSAEYSQRIAENCGKDEEYSKKAYYVTAFDAIGLPGVADKVLDFTGDEAMEMRRISKVSRDYVQMTTEGEERNAIPDYMARENFIREAGEKYDLAYANLMVKMIDAKERNQNLGAMETESKITCDAYREHVSKGIEISNKEKTICFYCENGRVTREISGAPSMVLFDSFDRRIHGDEKSIQKYQYFEYGEVWFDGHFISTNAKKIKLVKSELVEAIGTDDFEQSKKLYEIRAVRFEDHVRIITSDPTYVREITVALPDKTKSFYIGLTGECCKITDIVIESSEIETGAEEISRIVSEISYIDSLESDLKNVQIDRKRSAASEGREIQNRLKMTFHSMSLPSASLIWHCPAIVIYSSKYAVVNGADYREYALIKLNGEIDDSKFAQNKFKMKRNYSFLGWDIWKEINKEGLDYEVLLEKKGKRIILKANNYGIEIENVTVIKDAPEKVFVALTGDQVALTDIRVREVLR